MTPIILLDSFKHPNMLKLYFLIPSILTKITIFSSLFNLYLANLISSSTNDQNLLQLDENSLSDTEKNELILISENILKISKKYEIIEKQKINSEPNNKVYEIIKRNKEYLNFSLNLGVGMTILSALV